MRRKSGLQIFVTICLVKRIEVDLEQLGRAAYVKCHRLLFICFTSFYFFLLFYYYNFLENNKFGTFA